MQCEGLAGSGVKIITNGEINSVVLGFTGYSR